MGKAQLFFSLMTWMNVLTLVLQDTRFSTAGVECFDRVAKADFAWLAAYMLLSQMDISNMMGSSNKKLQQYRCKKFPS